MCHLTVTKQTSFTNSDTSDFVEQARRVLKEYRIAIEAGSPPVRYMHYAFMARGEPLANKHILENSNQVFSALANVTTKELGLPAKFCISTIMPQTLDRSLVDIFPYLTPTLYYSLYSVDTDFRGRWLPTAMPIDRALRLLAEYQSFSKKIVKIHFAFISGENDSLEDVERMCDRLDEHGLLCEFNLVGYNPASPAQGMESSSQVIERNIEYIRGRFAGKVKIISRVGRDVAASCGTFIS